MYGLNAASWCDTSTWWDYVNPLCLAKSGYDVLFPPAMPSLATPRAPAGDALTMPPISGEAAQALADQISNQQMRDQQAIAAAQVHSSIWDETLGGGGAAIDAAGNVITGAAVAAARTAITPLMWMGGALLVFGVVALGSGGARRYGR